MSKPYTFSFQLRAAGGPFDDPALLVTPANSEKAILFDCGTLHGLKTRDLQRVRWVFLSHLHIDHLIGFDHLLRVRLFSELPLTVFGPQGTSDVLSHRLQGYTWNLTSGSPFVVRAVDLESEPSSEPRGHQFRCHNQFRAEPLKAVTEGWRADGSVRLNSQLEMRSCPVKHGVPCLAYRLERTFPPQFSPQAAARLGLNPGPWVKKLVAGLAVEQTVDGQPRDQSWLAPRLLTPRLPESLGFLTDTLLDDGLSARLADFFSEVTVLCSEVAYRKADHDLAQANLHMTTHQVAALACRCRAGQLRAFHLSRRYTEEGAEPHLAELRSLFPPSELL